MNFLHWWLQFLHPGQSGKGGGYWFWSGIGSGSPILAVFVGWYKHHNCQQPGCWRPGHPHPVNHRPVCRKHHPHNV